MTKKMLTTIQKKKVRNPERFWEIAWLRNLYEKTFCILKLGLLIAFGHPPPS
jgi:hypothetical protein